MICEQSLILYKNDEHKQVMKRWHCFMDCFHFPSCVVSSKMTQISPYPNGAYDSSKHRNDVNKTFIFNTQFTFNSPLCMYYSMPCEILKPYV